MPRPSLFTPETYHQCLSRIHAVSPESKPQWGTMDGAQMFAHCAEIQEVANGKELRGTPFVVKLFRGLVRKMVLNEKPYPKDSKTHPQYRQSHPREFEKEKQRLLASLEAALSNHGRNLPEPIHPLFGKMTSQEKGWMLYKHLDHHLRQFGV